jgi:RNA polymerase sigma-54 factor
MNTLDFEEKMSEELLDNPALEKGDNENYDNNSEWESEGSSDNTFDIDEIVRASGGDDEAGGFRMGEDYSSEDRDEMPIRSESSFQDYLVEQARATFYDEKEMKLALHLINSIE